MITRVLMFLLCTVAGVASLKRPELHLEARIKEHKNRSGEVIAWESELRKIIVSWDRYPNAQLYEVCHMCDVDEATGVRASTEEGTVTERKVGREGECGMKPCLVIPGAPLGRNRFHVRVSVGGEWTPWSKHRSYDVQDVGRVSHTDEL